MANIINIDTSSNFCSVALAVDGEIVMGLESSVKMDHSVSLAPMVEKCMDYLKQQSMRLDAVSVSKGPGSYTGLRIGLSLAKGLAFGLDIPLITISTLMIMAVRGIFSDNDFQGEELIIPMLDAGRMEVYAAVLNSALNIEQEERALILNEDSFSEFKEHKKILFVGDGSGKFRKIYPHSNAVWLEKGMPHAKFMVPLSEKYYKDGIFSNLAYTVPSYLKEYNAQISKNRILNQNG